MGQLFGNHIASFKALSGDSKAVEQTKEDRQKAIDDLSLAFGKALIGVQAARANVEAEKHNEGLRGLMGLLAEDTAQAPIPDFAQPQKGKAKKAKAKFLGWEIGR